MILWILSWAVWLSPVAFLYWVVFRENPKKSSSPYSDPGWHFRLKRLWALWAVRRVKSQRAQRLAGLQLHGGGILPTRYECILEQPRRLISEDTVDSLLIHAMDMQGSHLIVRMTRMRHCHARLALQLKVGETVYQLPQLPDSLVSTTSTGWCAGGDWGGLRVELVEPLHLWRISFNGVLREGPPRGADQIADPGVLKHVRFNFVWTACSKPYNCRHDWGEGLLADTLAREPWSSGDWMDTIKSHVGGYDQWGTVYGQVLLEGAPEPLTLHLRGLRQRRWGPNEAGRLHRRVSVAGVMRNGAMFSVSADCHPGLLSHASYGHVRTASGQLHSIQWTSLSLPELAEQPQDIPRQFVLSFTAGGVKYSAGVYLPRRHGCEVYCERPWSYLMLLEPAECSLDGSPPGRGVMQGVGMAEFCYRYSGECPLTPPEPAALLREPDPSGRPDLPLVLHFPERECRCSAVVGGKGASLSALSSLAAQPHRSRPELDFVVPRGFCLTVAALERQLQRLPELRAARDRLDAVACGRAQGDLKQECERVSNLFASTPVCEDVRAELCAALGRLSDTQPGEQECWAVRSSAVGEDSEELSAAGQNATFLGCDGEAAVLEGVQRCWGSLYSVESVTYRRQHGQPVAAPMAVVVQRMVAARAAGVMFTCDPANGDPRRSVITANYGLGESVVSAAIDPDTVVVVRDPSGEMKIAEKKCGSKQHKVVMKEGGGVREEAVSSGGELCLSDEEVLQLAAVGGLLERAFGGPRDVEWAFTGSQSQPAKLCLLQARPVTALYKWTDFELLHETDSPIVSDEEVNTTANTGEVLPGATSVLTQSTTVRLLDLLVGESASGERFTHFFSRFTTTTHHHCTLNVLNVMLRVSDEKLTMSNKVAEMAVCGHSILNEQVQRAGLDRHGVASARVKLANFLAMVKYSWRAHEDLALAKALKTSVLEDVRRASSAGEAMAAIDRAMPVLKRAIAHHCLQSNVSVFSEIIAFSVLIEGGEELTADHLTDIASMLSLSQQDVESAQIPAAITEMVHTIRSTADWQAFAALEPASCLPWLQEHCPAAHKQLLRFLSSHGCRVIREFDLITVTWDMEPSRLITSLQTLVKQQAKEREAGAQQAPSLQDALKRLKSPQRPLTRFILSKLLPWFHRCVARRETTKAIFMRTVHQFRLAFRRLAELLEAEGRLPSQGLIFHLSYWELHRLLDPADPTHPVLLNKAARRQRRWAEWDNLSFPEMLHGVPQPLEVEDIPVSENGVTVKGGTASDGSVSGRACVVISLDNISQLQPGDILITHSTDVGWSPYFPLLGGVVTELGGLISHGAVVAREYGLPCLVGCQGATKVFRTGDLVKLNGSSGTISKIG